MEFWSEESPTKSAFLIGITYAIGSSLWILYSDALVQRLATTPAQLTQLQTYKGIGFIMVSSMLIFGLVYVALHRLTERNRRLSLALQQAELLHRILRHNLRNTCNIIAGNVELLDEDNDIDREARLRTIAEHNERLVELSRQSRYLRDFTNPTADDLVATNLAEAANTTVSNVESKYSEAVISLDTPDDVFVTAHYHIGKVLDELIENAIKHNPSSPPRVWISIRSTPSGVVCTVEDNGPGIPPVEQRVHTRGSETQTEHSQGLGLWLVYLTVEYSDGHISVNTRDGGGTSVTITLPAASPPNATRL